MALGWLKQFWVNPAYRFVFLFAVLLGTEVVVYPILTKRNFFVIEMLTQGTAQLAYLVLSAFSDEASISGNLMPPDSPVRPGACSPARSSRPGSSAAS